MSLCVEVGGRGAGEGGYTFILSTESVEVLACWRRYVCSMYSASRCRKLRGSLNITGMAIFDNS